MSAYRGSFSWIQKPQVLICFVVLCLFASAVGNFERLVSPHPVHAALPREQIQKETPKQYARPNCAIAPCVAVTFDDGPDEHTTPIVLDILAREQTPATFFVVGNRISGREAILQRMFREGHEIGNHTFGHPDLSRLSPGEVEAQIAQTQVAVMRAGVPAPRLIRPPYGSIDPMVASHNHLTVVRWNVDPEDWRLKDPAKVIELLMAQVRPGSIVLLHDIQPVTVAALESALQLLKQKYHIVSVSHLLNLTTGDEGQYFGRQ